LTLKAISYQELHFTKALIAKIVFRLLIRHFSQALTT